MSDAKPTKKKSGGKRIVSAVLFAVSALLLVAAAAGYILRGSAGTAKSLSAMRTQAVIHAASEGLVDNIAQQARADKLKELRKRKDFRKLGLDEVNNTCDAAAAEARAAAEALYSNPVISDTTGFEAAIADLEGALRDFGEREIAERAVFSELYVGLVEKVPDWTDLVAAAADDNALLASITSYIPDLAKPENAHLGASFVNLARGLATQEQSKDDAALLTQLQGQMIGAIADWTAFSGKGDDELWAGLTAEIPELSGSPFREQLLASAKEYVETAERGETVTLAEKDEGAATTFGTQTDYQYFAPSVELAALQAGSDAKYAVLWEELAAVIPDLAELSDKQKESMAGMLKGVIWPGSLDFDARYQSYSAEKGEQALSGAEAGRIRLAAAAQTVLIGGIAVLLLALILAFWKELTTRLGVPRTIITLFFIYLCLAAVLYDISVPMMLGNVLTRMGMYGVLVLAMLPGIQCGIGLNMGMTIGCIAGLMGIVLSLQFDMTGGAALIFACLSGAVISLPLGWGYSKLLNKMKGSEMTISTYVGFSFVSLMCIGWMMLPFNNPKIIWLLSGHGLRVTHSLLGSFAHLLDEFLSFRIFGIHVPSGVLLFVFLCCALMWFFTRSKTGIAMTAVGSNPRFAEASGINVDRMRTIGTVLSTAIAAVGIVIYSQAFGYAQLYTAPRQLGFIAASAILIGGATVRRAKVSHVLIGTFLFEGVLVLGQQIANSVVAGGGLSEVMRIMISNGIILYALTQSGGAARE